MGGLKDVIQVNLMGILVARYKYHYEYQVNGFISSLESNFAMDDLNKNNDLTSM